MSPHAPSLLGMETFPKAFPDFGSGSSGQNGAASMISLSERPERRSSRSSNNAISSSTEEMLQELNPCSGQLACGRLLRYVFTLRFQGPVDNGKRGLSVLVTFSLRKIIQLW